MATTAVTVPPLPAEADHAWYPHYTGLDLAIRELQTIVNGLTPPSGFVQSINSETPDPVTGNVLVSAADVGAVASGYAPGYGDLPLGIATYVDKDPITGFWPTGYNADGSPIYTSGSTNHGVRPHARLTTVVWRGADPSPDPITSGTGGMLRGMDERAIPNP